MKTKYINILLILFYFIFNTNVYAQYSKDNSFSRQAILKFEKDNSGFYYKIENQEVSEVNENAKPFGFNEITSTLYLSTNNAIYKVNLYPNYAKLILNDKNIPKYNDTDLNKKIKEHKIQIQNNINSLNELHKKELEIIKKEQYLDSLQNEKKLEEEQITYQKENKPYVLKINGVELKCENNSCEYIHKEAPIHILGIKNDTIYYLERKELALGVTYSEGHFCKIPEDLKNKKEYQLHTSVFKKEIEKRSELLDTSFMKVLDLFQIEDAIKELKTLAPYGYLDNYEWDYKYNLSFSFSYTNTNKKTIKYIDIYWKISNDVGDIRKTGNFTGTGPLEYLETSSWNWDHSSYRIAGDATSMEITKIILQYMDGSKKVLTGNMIKINI